MITIKIKNLRAVTILGIHDWEKEAKREVILNLALEVADTRAAQSDDIEDAVDYSVIEQRVLEHLDAASYNLIERLVADVAALVLSLDTRIVKLSIEADKPGALAHADSVSVALTVNRT